jgi:hypothetical protein
MSIKKLSYLLFPALILIFSCSKDEDPLDPNRVVVDDTSLYTGELMVQVNHWDGSHNIPAEWGFEVSLYFSREDAIDEFPYLTVQTNNMGEAYFGFLNMGNYYIKGSGSEGGQVYQSDITPAQVMPRRLNEVVLNVKQP